MGLHKVCGGCLLNRLNIGCPMSFVQSIPEVHPIEFSLTFNSNYLVLLQVDIQRMSDQYNEVRVQ
jgi:hypothetical protein